MNEQALRAIARAQKEIIDSYGVLVNDLKELIPAHRQDDFSEFESYIEGMKDALNTITAFLDI
jgi:hypothetical protein